MNDRCKNGALEGLNTAIKDLKEGKVMSIVLMYDTPLFHKGFRIGSRDKIGDLIMTLIEKPQDKP